MFGAKGIEHAEERVSLVIGDVMQPFPESVQTAGVDTLVMKHFLSAFNNKDASVILKHCSQVLAPKGKILLLQVRALCICCWLLPKFEQSIMAAMLSAVNSVSAASSFLLSTCAVAVHSLIMPFLSHDCFLHDYSFEGQHACAQLAWICR